MIISRKRDLETARCECAAVDQARELTIGCETWAITYEPGEQRGQMSRWPSGRGAVCHGGDSTWGQWVAGELHADDGKTVYNTEGEEVIRDSVQQAWGEREDRKPAQ